MSLEEKFPRKSRDPMLTTFVNSCSAVAKAQLTTGPHVVSPTGSLGFVFYKDPGVLKTRVIVRSHPSLPWGHLVRSVDIFGCHNRVGWGRGEGCEHRG